MLQDSEYTVHAQYKYLIFFQQCIAPQLGVFPQESPQQRYMSILTPYAVPFELSINYPRSLVRFSCEPVGPLAGTDLDPFNKGGLRETFEKLMCEVVEPYTEWYQHFARDLVISDEEASALMRSQGDQIPSQSRGQTILSADMRKDGDMMCKAYFYPYMKSLATGRTVAGLMFDSIRSLDTDGAFSASLSSFDSYLRSRQSDPSPSFSPLFLSTDITDPCTARIKIYSIEENVTWDAIQHIWTYGGTRTDDATLKSLPLLKELWTILAIPEGRRTEVWTRTHLGVEPSPEKGLCPVIVCETLERGREWASQQVYLTTWGMRDVDVAERLGRFFEKVGWEELAGRYMGRVKGY